MNESKNDVIRLNEELENLKNQKEKIASDLLDSENLNKKLKKENMLLINSNTLIDNNYEEKQNSNTNILNNQESNKDEINDNPIEKKEQTINQSQILEAVNQVKDGFEEEEDKIPNTKLGKIASLFVQTPKVIN